MARLTLTNTMWRGCANYVVFAMMMMVLVMVTVMTSANVLTSTLDESVTSISAVEAVQGGVAKLPCDISPSATNDKMHIVIWYKEGVKGKQIPIYTFDTRDKGLKGGQHWSDDVVLGGRALFRFQDTPALLTLNNVRDADSGSYFCRVDFQEGPTRNVRVNLTVIIPPEKLSILDDRGKHIPHYILGPYNEETAINITCVATGGRPIPKVTWWQENALLDETFETLTGRRVRNILHLPNLKRKDLYTVFTCQASNNNLVTPISSSVTLDMNLRPLWVKLLGENRPLSADSTYDLTCEVVGCKPPPTITWWKGSIQMTNTKEMTISDGNVTTSILTFTPTIDDGGKYLSCRGQQPLISGSGIEDGWKLDIYHVPKVSLELGSSLNGSVIKEGVDVYLECNIKANPWVYKVSWRHNGRVLFNNAAVGTIVSNQSLVLQNVTRARSGLYTCVGSNQEGDGESNAVPLSVKFAPVCRPAQPKTYGVGRQEMAEIRCELEANPTDIQFKWQFNNTDDTIVDLPKNLVVIDRSRSVISYKPITESDYGTLLCSGSNEVGDQKEPCVFYINPAGKPDTPYNCTAENQTEDSVNIECTEGFDGGLPQEFIMEVYHTQSGKLINNITSNLPYFTVSGLESGLGFQIGLYAANKKGRSETFFLRTHTLGAQKQTGFFAADIPNLLSLTPFLGTIIGVVGGLILVSIIIVVVIKLRGGGNHDETYKDIHHHHHHQSHCDSNEKSSLQSLNKDLRNSADSLEDKNPDIVPQNSCDNEYQEEERAFERLNSVPFRFRLEEGRIRGPYEHFGTLKKNNSEVTYAELALTKQPILNTKYNTTQTIPMSVIRTQEPTVYAQIDMTKCNPTYLHADYVPHQSTHECLPRVGEEPHDSYATAETPLINPTNTLLDATTSSRPPRVPSSRATATATRF